jgi:hypothetical protein
VYGSYSFIPYRSLVWKEGKACLLKPIGVTMPISN